MSEFTQDEIKAMAGGGNETHNRLYMANYDASRDMPEPSGHDAAKLREWLWKKYEQKLWYSDPNPPTQRAPEAITATNH